MIKIDLTKKGINEEDFATIAGEIQGNILKSHGRGHTSQIFFKFNRDKLKEAKEFIRKLAGTQITSALQQEEHSKLHKYKQVQKLFTNLYLSSIGYDYLGITDAKKPTDQLFRNGMKASNQSLGDSPIDTWDNGFQGEIHGMILLARGNMIRTQLDRNTNELIKKLRKNGLATILCVEEGDGIKNANHDDIEHFGYVDGISQPHFFEEELKGVPTNIWNSLMAPDLVLVQDVASNHENAFGSYFVFRKLEQNVKAFKTKEKDLAEELFNDRTSELAGAMVVGRFENGMPVTLSSADNNTTIVPIGHEGKINDFDYRDDSLGAKCPFHAHIRKTNPRGESPFEDLDGQKSHIMARRGIIYGHRFVHPNEATLEEMPTKDVGLLFMSFQKDIGRQFEFLQSTWANNDNFVKNLPQTGKDPVIGQGSFPDNVHQYAQVYDDENSIRSTFGFGNFVTLKGGEYFFAPSMDFLKNIR